MAYVFISFIHEEIRIARAVQAYLKTKLPSDFRQEIFFSADDWQIFAGEIWLNRIEQELQEAKVVILMLSPDSVKRPWINFEAGAAWLAKKAVIPVCFNGLTKSHIPKPYSDMQAVNLCEDLYYLLRSVLHHLDPYAPPPPPKLPSADDDDYEYREIKNALAGRPQVFRPPPPLSS